MPKSLSCTASPKFRKTPLLVNLQENESGTGTQFLPWEGTILPSEHGRIDPGVFLSEPDWDLYDANQSAFTLLFDHQFNDNWGLHGVARQADSEVEYRSMWPAFPPTLIDGRRVTRTVYESDAESDVLVGDLRVEGRFETGDLRHHVVVGFDMQDATTDNDIFYGYAQGGEIDVFNPEYGNVPGPISVTNAPSTTTTQQGVYINDRMTFRDRWIVSLGLRRDETESRLETGGTSQEDDATTGRLALMHRFDNGFAPYANVSQSFLPVAGQSIDGELYKPQEGTQTEIGFKYQPQGSRGLITAALYDIHEETDLLETPIIPTIGFKPAKFASRVTRWKAS